MQLNKWDKYLYQNYDKVTGALVIGATFTFLFTTLTFNRFLNIFGSIFIIVSAIAYYFMEKRYKKIKREMEEARIMEVLYKKCIKRLHDLESVLNQLGYLTKMDKLMILDELWEELTWYCVTVNNFQSLLKRINQRIQYFEERVKEFKERQSSQRHNFYTSSQSVVENLRILGLSPDTNDFQVIQTRYRQLMKKYHPDLNKSPKAAEMAKEINNAYDQLKKIFAH